jgi:hypothetical protein
MKQLSKFFAPVAFAAAALCAPQAYAAGQYASNSQYLGNATYIGVMDPSAVPVENAFVRNDVIAANSSFTNFWVVDINPTGNVAASLSFLNIGSAFTAFSVQLYLAQSPLTNVANAAYTCASANQSAGAVLCAAGPGALTLINTNDTPFNIGGQSGSFFANTTTFLTAGRYVVKVSGTTASGSNPTYSGQIQVNQIPEPGSLALSGLALLGAAAAMRKRKAA